MISWKIAATALIALLNGSNVGSFYAQTFAVVEVDEDYITCVDFNGEEWAFDNEEDWCVGDLVSAIMYDNATPNSIYDDEFITVKYSGWCSSFGWDIEYNCPVVEFDYE